MAVYAAIGQLASAGRYPYVDYWMESPPMLAWYAVRLFTAALALPWLDPVSAFHYLHVSLAVLADLVALGLFHWLAWRLYGPLTASLSGLFYAALLPGYRFAVEGMADSLVVPFLLGGLCLLIANRPAWAGAVTAFGFGLKLFPAVLLVTAVWASTVVDWSSSRSPLSALLALTLLPLVLLNPLALRTSAAVLLARPSCGEHPGAPAWELRLGRPARARRTPVDRPAGARPL